MTKKTKKMVLKLPKISSSIYQQSFEDLMQDLDKKNEVVTIDVGCNVIIETSAGCYNTHVVSIDEEFNLITVVDGDTNKRYFWDETPDIRLFEAEPDTVTGLTSLETITNITVCVEATEESGE